MGHPRQKNFITSKLKRDTPELQEYFAEDILQVQKPKTFFQDMLLDRSISIPTQCLQFSGKGDRLMFSPASYTLESDMIRLLDVKQRTGGKNTDLLGAANCHATGFPVGIQNPREKVLIAKDKTVNAGRLKIPRLDVAHANYSKGPQLDETGGRDS